MKARDLIPYSKRHPKPKGDRMRSIDGYVYVSGKKGWCLIGSGVDPEGGVSVKLKPVAPLIKAARKVVARWESGDLAEAVRELDRALHKFDGKEYKP